jgi:hypothetical protein
LSQLPRNAPISALITSDLLMPVAHLALGTGPTFSAPLVAMPKAAMHKHSEALLREEEVRLAR